MVPVVVVVVVIIVVVILVVFVFFGVVLVAADVAVLTINTPVFLFALHHTSLSFIQKVRCHGFISGSSLPRCLPCYFAITKEAKSVASRGHRLCP